MTRFLKVYLLMLLVGGVSACAGGADPSRLPEPAGPRSTAIPLGAYSEAQQTWQRPVQPGSNNTFTLIDGTPYYRIGPDDELEMVIYLENEPTTLTLTVSPAGEIRLPVLLPEDRIRVAGLAVPQAEERIAAALERTLRHPQLSLKVSAYRSSLAILIGEITNRPGGVGGEGRYPLTGRVTLLDFILTNATFTDQSDLTAVMVTGREGRSGIFDLSASIYGGTQNQNPVLDSGDRVLVPSVAITRQRIFVLGEVENPSLLAARPGLTILDAITEVGGPTERARLNIVTLVRGRGTEAELYSIPYRDIVRRGQLEWNARLEPGDIIYVGRSSYNSAIAFFRDTWSVLQTALVITLLVDRF